MILKLNTKDFLDHAESKDVLANVKRACWFRERQENFFESAVQKRVYMQLRDVMPPRSSVRLRESRRRFRGVTPLRHLESSTTLRRRSRCATYGRDKADRWMSVHTAVGTAATVRL
ncbi:hypothetical protein MRX96_015572 [Rhipicephalus microplus]